MVMTDVDTWDRQPHTIHVLASLGDAVAGTVRLYPLDLPDRPVGRWKGDRLAVLPAHRSSLVGVRLVRFAVASASAAGGIEMEASVQVANTAFFEHLGWQCDGPVVAYFGLPHQPMLIDLHDVPTIDIVRPLLSTLRLPVGAVDRSPLLVAS